ncbi:hypothetical protein D8682_05940 [Buttiauxella sp. 3AFRM03]|uniref:hypothetical protein n=1 Tax=Buttiauxella sp. 3AFRM03 TaxID=2479367 RepID=UPI000EF80B88|nr:hypothetical protein [Buttiauxella sp. 3AFRM03]AYN30282.1 hypothetical protein D8682_05940 [Buttiauxella sp. 3AFRM03]
MVSKKSKIASMAAAMAVALAPVPASSIGNLDVSVTSHSSSTLSLQSVKDSVVFLPIDQATVFMRNFADRMNIHRLNIRAEWEEKRAPIRIDRLKKETQEGFAIFRSYVDVCAALIDAIRIALKDIPESDVELRKEIISFGRAVASVRYTIEDMFSFIEATIPPKKTTEALPKVTAKEVHALIRSEHKKLGLEEPKFY